MRIIFIYLFLLVSLLIVVGINAQVSLQSLDKEYNTTDKTISVTNDTKPIADLSLIYGSKGMVKASKNKTDLRKFAEIEIESFKDFNKAIGTIDFYKLFNDYSKFNRKITIKRKNQIGTISVNNISRVCVGTRVLYPNKSEIMNCKEQVVGSYNIPEYNWVNFNKDLLLSKSNLTLGLFTYIYEGERIEWIPRNWFGIDIEEWADFSGYTMYEWYNTNDDDKAGFDANNKFRGNTFVVGTTGTNESFTLTGVAMKMYKVSNPSGSIDIEIRASILDTPNGGILSSGSIDFSEIGTSAAWFNISMTQIILNQGDNYSILAHADGVDGSNYFYLRQDASSPSYTGGRYCLSNDNASSWSCYATNEALFEIWGTIPDIIIPNVTINIPENITYTSASITYNLTTIDNTAMDSCWYTLDGGVENITMNNATATNFYYENVSNVDGSWLINFYCNDTNNNVNNTEFVSYEVGIVVPGIDAINIITSVCEFGYNNPRLPKLNRGNDISLELINVEIEGNLTVEGNVSIEEDLNITGELSYYAHYAQTSFHNDVSPLIIGLSTEDVYENVTGLNVDYGHGIDTSSGIPTITKDSMYQLIGSISFSGGNSGRYRFNLFVNSVEEPACGAMRTTDTANLGSLSINCLVYLEDDDQVNMRVMDTTSPVQNVSIHTLTFNMVQIG